MNCKCVECCRDFLAAPSGKAKVCGLIALTVLACVVIGLMGTALRNSPHTWGARIFAALTLPGAIVLTVAAAGVVVGVGVYGARSCRLYYTKPIIINSTPMPPHNPVKIPQHLIITPGVWIHEAVCPEYYATWGRLKMELLKRRSLSPEFQKLTVETLEILIRAQGEYRKIKADLDEPLEQVLLRYSCENTSRLIISFKQDPEVESS